MLAVLAGGARSGKSSLGQRLAASAVAPGASVVVVVTAEAGDDEMVTRIERHRTDRPAGWATVEAPRALLDALVAVPDDAVVLVDCASFWVANRVMDGADEATLVAEATAVAHWAAARTGWVVVVTNEVGLGVVPEHELGRVFRDVAGRVNAALVAHADRAWFVVAGRVLPLVDAPTVLA